MRCGPNEGEEEESEEEEEDAPNPEVDVDAEGMVETDASFRGQQYHSPNL